MAVIVYRDKYGNKIEKGDTIKYLENGTGHIVYENADRDDLGLNATNPNCKFVNQRLIYPLYQFDLDEWVIVKKT